MKIMRPKTRHIDIHYFFIKDVLKRENITLAHCPTEEMLADFYTKPLQGSLFRKMRDYIMGHSASLNEERVEKSPNKLICEPGNETEFEVGLDNGTEQIVPGVVNGDAIDVNSCGQEQPAREIKPAQPECQINPAHKIEPAPPACKTYADVVKSYADVVKGIDREKKVKFYTSSHSFKIIQ